MSHVHVLVSASADEEHAYAAAMAGMATVYRFGSNVEAFERLAAASAPIAVLVVSAQQDSLFNMTADQLVTRLVDTPLARSAMLGGMRIVVVGELARRYDRTVVVSSLAAAIDYLKHGRLEQRPARVQAPEPASRAGRDEDPGWRTDVPAAPEFGGGFADSLISSIWRAADEAAERPRRARRSKRRRPRQTAPARPATVVGGGASTASQDGLFVSSQSLSVAPAVPGAAGALQPALPAHVPSSGQYLGPGPRALSLQGASTAAHGAPTAEANVPPQLAAQVHQMVYPSGNPQDPVLGWSSAVQQQLAAQAGGHQPQPVPQQQAPLVAAVMGGGPATAQHDMTMVWNGHGQQQLAAVANPAHAAVQRGVQRTLQQIHHRVAGAERAPTVPTGVGRPPQRADLATRADLLDRMDSRGDVSFG